MNIKCPHCNQVFDINSSEADMIVSQIKSAEFNAEVEARVSEFKGYIQKECFAKAKEDEDILRQNLSEAHEKEVAKLKEEIDTLFSDKQKLLSEAGRHEQDKKLAVLEAVAKVEKEKSEFEVRLANEKENTLSLLKAKDAEIDFYKNMKSTMSTKMIGETLEQHCALSFEQIRGALPPTVYFDKDNEVSKASGSKGDFIYKEFDENGVEIISIMFEMKNEADATVTKHRNEDFFKELDKDRKEKGCEYAVLVTMLERDSEYYNAGIVSVAHKYDKMYVVRPQCFIPIITLLRNAALNAMKYKQELAIARNQNLDVSNFEKNLMDFKNTFTRNYDLAHKHFDSAIDEIDKAIDRLNKVKEFLQKSDNQYRIASNKVDDVSVKRLTKDCPSVREMIEQSSSETEVEE